MTTATRIQVTVSTTDFDVAALQKALLSGCNEEGAVATFTGYVRGSKGAQPLHAMQLEHYPGMTEQCLQDIAEQAAQRWPLHAAGIVHRIGELAAGAQIVWVGVAAGHRQAAFDACEFIMDYLKTQAPFWKKELGTDGGHWVDAREQDSVRAQRWQE